MEIIKKADPDKAVASIKPRYHPEKPIQGIIAMDEVNICAIKADAQFALPEIFWAPSSDDPKFALSEVAIKDAFVDRMQSSNGRHVDTSMWCK